MKKFFVFLSLVLFAASTAFAQYKDNVYLPAAGSQGDIQVNYAGVISSDSTLSLSTLGRYVDGVLTQGKSFITQASTSNGQIKVWLTSTADSTGTNIFSRSFSAKSIQLVPYVTGVDTFVYTIGNVTLGSNYIYATVKKSATCLSCYGWSNVSDGTKVNVYVFGN